MGGPALDRVQAKLQGWKTISGGWVAKCPAHDDQHQSLQISERTDLSVGLHCHAGCTTINVCSAMGLTFADLYSSTTHDGKQIAATYDYRDSKGQLLYQAVRYWPKDFRHRRPDGAGDWIWDMAPFKGKHVPYRLPDLKGHNDVCIVEGEKDADRLWSIGIAATTNIGGAKNWTAHDTKCLKIAGCTRAFLIPDNDEAGHARIEMVAKSVKAAAIAVSVIDLLELDPDLGPSGDVSDWLSNGGSKEALQARMVSIPYVVPPEHVHTPIITPGPLPDALPDPLKYSMSHAGAADAFCDRFGHLMRFDHTRERWYIWDEHRWRQDPDEAICRMALDHIRRWAHEVIQTATFTDRKKWQDFTLRLEQVPQLQAMLRAARSVAQVKVSGLVWDTNPWLLGVPNGVLDLKTAELRDGAPADLITLQAGVPYDPDAACPRWLQFLTEVFGSSNEDLEVIEFVRRFCGYCLTGRTSEQLLVMCYGTGRNGKGRLWAAMRGVLGEYAAVLPFSSLIANRKGSDASNDLAAIQGKRVVVASEVNEGARLNAARIKALTGEDPITARFLYAEYATFDPMAKFVLAVNSKPDPGDDSEGFWQRVRLLPFTRQFVGAMCDPALDEKLRAEWPGILAWAVQGGLAWQHGGRLPAPKVIMDATKEYEHDSDVLEDFLIAECEDREATLATAHETGNTMFRAYLEWCDSTARSKEDRLTSTKFGIKLSKKFKKTRDTGRVLYFGVQLKPRKSALPYTSEPVEEPPLPSDPDSF